jgi:hypothetical protein
MDYDQSVEIVKKIMTLLTVIRYPVILGERSAT